MFVFVRFSYVHEFESHGDYTREVLLGVFRYDRINGRKIIKIIRNQNKLLITFCLIQSFDGYLDSVIISYERFRNTHSLLLVVFLLLLLLFR